MTFAKYGGGPGIDEKISRILCDNYGNTANRVVVWMPTYDAGGFAGIQSMFGI